MSNGINSCHLIGNLGQDPETRFTPEGRAITNFTIATSDSWKDKNSGQKMEKTEWHRIVAFGKVAEIIGEYAKKGSKVYVQGKIQTRKWQDKDGADKWTTEIVVNQFQLLDRKESQQTANAASQQAQAPSQAMPNNFDDSDLPF